LAVDDNENFEKIGSQEYEIINDSITQSGSESA
jgi:hypothetical protein